MSKTIAFLGNFLWPFCSESQYKVELESLGHTVIPLQETSVSTDTILETALKSDIFFWVHSHGVENGGAIDMKVVLEKLREAHIPSMAYHLDLYMPLDRWQEYENADYFKVDHFFTVDKLMADWFNENTATKGHYLLAGAFSGQNYIADYDLQYASNVSFIGSRGYHEVWAYRPQLIDWLNNTYKDSFAHWGNDGKEVVREEKFNKVCSSSKIIVGDTLCIDFKYPYYFSERVYNVTGAGSFIIHPYIKGLENSFELGKELVTYQYGDFVELKDKIDYYLANPKERNDIRVAGYLRTKRDHLYKHRMQTMLETIYGN